MTSPPKPDETMGLYWGFSSLAVVLGIFLMVAPDDYFGPSWHFFPQLPANGFWMGLCCTMLGTWQVVVLWRDHLQHTLSRRTLAWLFFLGAFVIWTAALCLIVAGISGHQGLMEGPFMLIVAGYKIIISSQLSLHARREKRANGGR